MGFGAFEVLEVSKPWDLLALVPLKLWTPESAAFEALDCTASEVLEALGFNAFEALGSLGFEHLSPGIWALQPLKLWALGPEILPEISEIVFITYRLKFRK